MGARRRAQGAKKCRGEGTRSSTEVYHHQQGGNVKPSGKKMGFFDSTVSSEAELREKEKIAAEKEAHAKKEKERQEREEAREEREEQEQRRRNDEYQRNQNRMTGALLGMALTPDNPATGFAAGLMGGLFP